MKSDYVFVKDEGIRSFHWSKRWIVLHPKELILHRSPEDSSVLRSIPLSEITSVTRNEAKPFCLLVKTQKKEYFLSFPSEKVMFDWQDSVEKNAPKLAASAPTGFKHLQHVDFDPETGTFKGLPDEWNDLLGNSKITKDEMRENPEAVIGILKFYTEEKSSPMGAMGVKPEEPPKSPTGELAEKTKKVELASPPPAKAQVKEEAAQAPPSAKRSRKTSATLSPADEAAMIKLRAIVNTKDPKELYTKSEKLGQGASGKRICRH